MKIISGLTGSTSISNQQVQKAISHLLVVKQGAAAIANETISAAIQFGGNQHAIATKMKVRDMGIISQFENGYILQEVNGSGIKTAILLELTGSEQGIVLQNEDYITLDFAGLVAGSTYDVYGLEAPVNGKAFLSYVATNITGSNSTSKAYSLNAGHRGLHISNNDSLEKVRLFTHAGGEVSYLPEELSAIAREINPITFMADKTIEGDSINQTIAGGGSEFFYIPTDGFKGFEITTVGGVELTFILTEAKGF